MTSPPCVKLEIKGLQAILTIERPEALNALNQQVLTELLDRCETLAKNTHVQVVIVTGSGGKAFVAGADIREMQYLTSLQAQAFSVLGMNAFRALENLPQVVIAKVNGFALGGGLELALACDFIVASDKSRFGLPEVTLGLIPGFAGTQRLARRIGLARALEWVTSAEKYDAPTAFAHGLINHIVKSEELDAFTDTLGTKITKNAPQAVRLAKQVMRTGIHSSFESGCALETAHFAVRFSTPEAQEGITAFVEKRPPNFKM